MTRRLFTLAIFAVIGIISSVAMSIERAREEADFLTDKMAYELGLTESQWSDVYEINYDYFRSMNHLGRSYVRESELRDAKLRYVLTSVQWDKYCAINYFLVPVRAGINDWIFSIYEHYKRNLFYYNSRRIVDVYRGGHRKHQDFYQNRYQPRYRQTPPSGGQHHIPQAGHPSVAPHNTPAPMNNHFRGSSTKPNHSGTSHRQIGGSRR